MIEEKFFTEHDFMTIEQIKDEMGWPPEYCSTIGLVPYIKRLGDDIQGIEIGTGRGESAAVLLDRCPNIKKLHTIDHFMPWINWDGFVSHESQERFKQIAYDNLREFGDRVEIHEMDASDAVKVDGFFESSMNFIYIDGDPSEEQTHKDLQSYYQYLKPKGIMAGHNFQFKTVYEAVTKFRKDNKITTPIQKSSNGIYFWYKQ